MERSFHSESGFTLLEIMAVVLIIGVLTAIAVASYSTSVGHSQLIACQGNRRVLADAVEMYQQQHAGSLPATSGALAPFVAGRAEFDVCPADLHVRYTIDPLTGHISCPLHPDE